MKKIIGITGTIAAGKSTVSRYIEEKYGILRIDADVVGHEILLKKEVIQALCDAFTPEILDENGQIIRRKLGNLVFSSPDHLQKLNSITHPAICREIRQRLEAYQQSESTAPFAMVEAIELLRSPLKDMVDEVWVVCAEDTIRLKRLMERDGLDESQAWNRIRSQWPQEQYKKMADRVIDNSVDPETLEALLDQLLEEFSV